MLKELKCAAARVFAFVSMPIDTATPHFCSLENNRLCGLGRFGGDGTYTPEGFTKLCEGLKGSAVTSLKCAAAHCSVRFSRPLTLCTPLLRQCRWLRSSG